MRASRTFAAGLLFAASLRALALDVGLPPPQCAVPSSPTSSSSPQTSQPSAQDSHRGAHHVQVPDEDSPAQPAELTAAEAAIEKRDYEGAERLLRKLTEHDGANYVAWFDLGFVENALGKVDESIAAYRKSVAAKPDVFESNLNLGLQLAKTSQADAEEFLRAATHLKPTSHAAQGEYRAWLSLAHVLEKSNPDEALRADREAATLQPKEAEPHLFAGQLLEKENKFADSELEYKQALALDSQSSDAVVGLANIYMQGRRFPEAEDSLRKLLAIQPNSGPAHIQMGRVLAAEGKNDEAVAELQAGLNLEPVDDAAHREVADLFAAAGKNDLAEGAYRELLAVHPNDAELHRRLGEALLLQKKFVPAQQEFASAIKLKPDLGEAYGGLAFAASNNKDYALVIRSLDARAKLLPEVPTTYFLRASAYDHLHDPKKAATNYHLFLKAANGKYPEQEWQATHRLIALEPKK
ncbi:MAG TPA: tetratricopeptide repeat protein [Candidatus Dormibacteraeota bacterium]|jgi:tetratricopeptide (TPR) repeat protein|nr:tetratricopeptide repeat protein [Candidatus Dormibacteraeota bacterium]